MMIITNRNLRSPSSSPRSRWWSEERQEGPTHTPLQSSVDHQSWADTWRNGLSHFAYSVTQCHTLLKDPLQYHCTLNTTHCTKHASDTWRNGVWHFLQRLAQWTLHTAHCAHCWLHTKHWKQENFHFIRWWNAQHTWQLSNCCFTKKNVFSTLVDRTMHYCTVGNTTFSIFFPHQNHSAVISYQAFMSNPWTVKYEFLESC